MSAQEVGALLSYGQDKLLVGRWMEAIRTSALRRVSFLAVPRYAISFIRETFNVFIPRFPDCLPTLLLNSFSAFFGSL